MARRQSSEDFDPFDEEFSDDDLERVDLDDLRLEVENLTFEDDDDTFASDFDEPAEPKRRRGFGRRRGGDDEQEKPARAARAKPSKPARPRTASNRPPLRVGQIIGGLLQVIIYAVVALAIFLAIGFGVVFAGQQLGVIPPSTHTTINLGGQGGSSPAVAAVPTNPPAEQPTIAPTEPPPPTATVDPGCPTATDWWNSQQIQDNYTYFSTKALDDARGSNRIPALVEQMQIRRDFVANYRMSENDSPCLDPLRADLLRGFDATINAVRVVNSDDAGANTQMSAADQAYNDLFAALRALGVTVTETAAAPS